jgi:hypothetical protein
MLTPENVAAEGLRWVGNRRDVHVFWTPRDSLRLSLA